MKIESLYEAVHFQFLVIVSFYFVGAGDFAVAYLFYKLATPLRYTVTLVGTRIAVKKLRKHGYIETPDPDIKISNLVKHSQSRMKDKIYDVRGDLKDNVSNLVKQSQSKMKYKIQDVRGEMKGNVKEKMDSMKERMERLAERKLKTEKLKEKFTKLKDRRQKNL